MILLRCMLLIVSTLLFCDIAVAFRKKYFEYGDKNRDGKITDEEAEGNKNMAWLSEWRDLKRKMQPDVVDKLKRGGAVTFREFAEISSSHGKRLLG